MYLFTQLSAFCETTEGRENRIKNDFRLLMSCVMAGVGFW
jgi:hypothetical protein